MAEGEIFRATVISQHNDGTAFLFNFGFKDTAVGGTHIDTSQAAGDFQTAMQAILVAGMLDTVSIKRYRFACVYGTHLGEIGYVEVAPPVFGSLSSDNPLPHEVAATLKRSTGYATRRDRGRIFWGPLTSFAQDGTYPDKCSKPSAFQDIADKLDDAFITQGRTLQPCIVASDGTTNGKTITKVSIGDVLAHRKSRRFRVGI